MAAAEAAKVRGARATRLRAESFPERWCGAPRQASAGRAEGGWRDGPARRRSLDPGADPQELQVALLVAEGASNREVATRLFISPRTVEYHLYKIYPKLGVVSRSDLVRHMATSGRQPTE